ncbi:MAG: ribosome-associated translation inhibitor RaiA [Betaproteobacteria bacterium]|nr:MAG: ribosome-associated translation inhibitor RaiA [Betaproteobacteria bacterium]
MQVPLRITVRHMPQSPALEERIRDEVAKLENFNARIVSCYVTIEEIARHKQQGRRFSVRIDLRIPQHELVVNHKDDEDVYVALKEAFAGATRQLEGTARRQRGEVKAHSART